MTDVSSTRRRLSLGSRALTPLTRMNGLTGQPFERNANIERQITEALNLDPSLLVERSKIRDRNDPRFLQEECLVYLIRNSNHEERTRWMASDLAAELLGRMECYLSRHLRQLGPDHCEEASDEVVVNVFEKITDRRSDLGDFAQVSFWTFLAAKVSDVYRKHLSRLKKERAEIAPHWVHGTGPAGDGEQSFDDRWEREPESGSGPDAMLLNEELLGTLPEHYYVMMKLHLAGWPIESKSGNEQTISSYFGKTPRTINNWLRDAQRLLAGAWEER